MRSSARTATYRARLPASLPEEGVDVGDRPEVAQLVRVDHGSDRLHRAGDVEREDVRDPPLHVEHEATSNIPPNPPTLACWGR